MIECLLCASEPASVELPVENVAGEAFALPARTPVGATCLSLFGSGADDALAARLSEDFEDFDASRVVALLRRRAGQPTAFRSEPGPTEGVRQQGFVPLAEHTGVGAELGPLWPATHRISRADLRQDADDPDDLWLVRSPWEAMTVPDVLTVLWQWVERDPYPHQKAEWTARVLEVFALDEASVLQLL